MTARREADGPLAVRVVRGPAGRALVGAAVMVAFIATGASGQPRDADARGGRSPVPGRPAPDTLPRAAEASDADEVREDARATTAADPGDWRGRGEAIRIAPTLRVAATPRTVHVLTVAVPSAFADADSVAFAVHPSRTAPIAGAREGKFMGGTGRVPLSVSIPARAPAGRLRIGDVRFRRADGRGVTMIVPIELDIAPVHALTLSASSTMLTAVAGSPATVRLGVANAGNVTDSIRLVVAVPEAWRARIDGDALVVVRAGDVAYREVRVTPPREAGATGGTLVVRAVAPPGSGDDPPHDVARVAIPVEVLAPSSVSSLGPVIGVSYNEARLPGAAPLGSWALSLDGPIGGGITAHASWAQRPLLGAPGVARVGSVPVFPSLTLEHARWRAELGVASMPLGELTGLAVQGQGAGLLLRDSTWRLQTMVARPFALGLSVEAPGRLVASRLEVVRDATTWSLAASHLRDGIAFRGALDALAVGAQRELPGDVQAAGEVAWRRWDGGGGAGGRVELSRRVDAGDWRVRVQHAPGGSRAFARATTDATVSGAQLFGALRLGWLGWHVTDAVQGATQRTDGVGIVPQIRLGRATSLGAEWRRTTSSGGDATARLGADADAHGVFVTTALGPVTFSASGTRLDFARSVALEGERRTTRERQYLATAQAALPTPLGVADVYASHQRSAGDDALLQGQQSLQLRLDQLTPPFPMLRDRVRLGGAIGVVRNVGDGRTFRTERFGASFFLPGNLALRVDAERNPLFALSRDDGWMTVLRIEHRFGAGGLLRFGQPGGTVFEDTNGNGVRDGGERGLPGVLVRVAGEVAVTDSDGRFVLQRARGGVAELDERSLPFGWMVPPRSGSIGMDGSALDIPVVPVGAVEVRLETVDEPYAAGAPPSLATVLVAAVDAAGRRYVARHLDDGRVVFDALPPGDYSLEVDASGTSEPLAVRGSLPAVRVGGMRQAQRFVVRLGPRRLRMFQAAPVRR